MSPESTPHGRHPGEELPPPDRVLRRSRGTCPRCTTVVPADTVVRGSEVYLEKRCPAHGLQQALLSRRADYYGELLAYFHAVMPRSLPQRDYILRLTGRCNMRCPICLASSDQYEEQDLPLSRVRRLLAEGRRVKLDLMGAEPTLHPELEQLVREAAAGGHITALHTNGINIAEPEALGRLVRAGLSEVHLQFDGFDDAHDAVLRGRPMAALRRKVLKNLEEQGVATDLVVTILRGLNEAQMVPVLRYAAEHPFVKEVFYLGCRRLGRATEAFARRELAPDELIDELEARTEGRISRDDLRVFNKLYFALLSLFGVRKCLYIHHYLVLRDGKGGFEPVSRYIDLPYLEPHLDAYRRRFARSRARAAAGLLPHIALAIARKRGLSLLSHAAALPLMMGLGFDLSLVQRRPILLGFITACDPWIHDAEVAENCGKGELSTDLGRHESGAEANVARERLHRRLDRRRAGEEKA